MAPRSLAKRIDPTRPERWGRMRDRAAREAFVLRYGVAACGAAAALVCDAYLLTRRGDWDVFFSLRHAVQLEITVLFLAPTVGAMLGRALLRVGDRRYAQDELKRAFTIDAAS